VIGAGRIGANHAKILSEQPEVGGLLITDVLPDRAAHLAGSLTGATATSLDEVYERCDGLVIASSTDTHSELLIRAAKAGLPTFCEKPIALDLASTRAAVAAIEAAGITVQMGFQRRYDPGIRAVREKAAAGALGTLFLVRSQTHDPAPPPLEYVPSSGGIFKDCLIHDIDAVRYVTAQEVVAVTAFGTQVGHPEIAALGDFGTAGAVLEMSAGTLAQISGMRLDPIGYDVRLEAFGSRSAVAAGWSDRTPIVSTEPGVAPPADPIMTFWDRFDSAYRAELRSFMAVVRGEEKPVSEPADALQNLRVALACDRSVTEGRRVRIEEIE
jgi:myo-inositol 2-dehydrogenase/D-chiro-inositol 1-dehydrogenase